MNYEVKLVNPQTSEQRKIIVSLSPDQAVEAEASPCVQSYVQTVARPDIPEGFMPLGCGVRPVTLQ